MNMLSQSLAALSEEGPFEEQEEQEEHEQEDE
jgi:hypothetical protein